MVSILITGASGFIGSFLVEEALKRGWKTWAGVRPTSNLRYLKDDRILFIDLDFSDKEKLKQQISQHIANHGSWDYIVHNAGVTKCVDNKDFEKINYQHTVHFIEALKETDNLPQKFIYMSSLSVSLTNNLYGQSKRKTELYLQSLNNFPYQIIRPTGVYGPREKDYFLMLKTVKSGLDVAAGFKKQYLTFIYVTDLSIAVFLALESPLKQKIYEISDGNVYTDAEYTNLVRKLLNKKLVLRIKIPLFLVYAVSVLSEFFSKMAGKTSTLNRDKYIIMKQRDWRCNPDLSPQELGFSPAYNLEEGLTESIKWYRENGWL